MAQDGAGSGGISPSTIVPVLLSLVALAGPLYPLGLLLEQRQFHDSGLSAAASWDAAFLIPRSHVVLQGLRYAIAPSALALLVLAVVAAFILFVGLRFFPWVSTNPNTFIRGCAGWIVRARTIGVRGDKTYTRSYIVVVNLTLVVLLVDVAYLKLYHYWSQSHADVIRGLVWPLFGDSVIILGGAALFSDVYNLFDFRASVRRFSSRLAIVAILLLAACDMVIAAVTALPRSFYFLPWAIVDVMILIYMFYNVQEMKERFRLGAFVLVVHLCTITYALIVALTYHSVLDSTSWILGTLVGGLGAGIACYLAIQIAFGNVALSKWFLAGLIAYGAALLSAYVTGFGHVGPDGPLLARSAICTSKNHLLVQGVVLDHNSGNCSR